PAPRSGRARALRRLTAGRPALAPRRCRSAGEARRPRRPGRLALRVLRRLARLLQAVLLALLLASISREKARTLERGSHLGVELGERTSDAETQGAGLTRDATTVERRVDVVDLGGLREAKRLGHHHPVRRGGEV